MADITPTVLERVVVELMARLEAMNDDNEQPIWNKVFQGPIASNSALSLPALGLEQGPEETRSLLYPLVEKVVTFYLEFRYKRVLNLDNYQTFRYYLGKLQKRLFGGTNKFLTVDGVNLAVDVIETNSNPMIESQADNSPGGMVIFQVVYRHVQEDPYKLPSELTSYA